MVALACRALLGIISFLGRGQPSLQFPYFEPCQWLKIFYRAFQVARTAMQLQHVIKLKLSSQLIGQFGHVTASASCKQPEKHGKFKKNPVMHRDDSDL